MTKPVDLKSKSMFMGKYWIEVQENGDLIIMPRMHHSSNPGTPAGIEIVRFQPIELRIGVHEGNEKGDSDGRG